MALMTQVGLEFIARNKANQQIGSFTRSVKNLGRQMLYMAGVGGGLYAFKRGFEYIINKAMEQERVLIELSRALKTTGEYSAKTMSQFRKFAASIQQVTIYGDEQVLSLMRLINSLGVSADQLEHATKTAIGLAAATNRDVQSMAQYVALAQQGEFTMLRRYIPALRATTDKTEQLRIVNEFAARGFQVAMAEAESTAGTFKQFKNAVGDLAEEIGNKLLPALTKVAKALTEVIQGKSDLFKFKIEYNRDWLRELKQDVKEAYQEPMTLITGKKPEWEGSYGTFKLPTAAEMQAKYVEAYDRAMSQKPVPEAVINKIMEMEKAFYTSGKNIKKKIEDIREKQVQEVTIIKDRWNEMAWSIESSFSSSIERMIFEGEKFRDVMKSIFHEIAIAAIRALFIQPAAEATTGLIKSIGLSILSSGGITGTLSKEGAYALAGMPAPGAQAGGYVERGGLARIHTGENIIPAGAGMNPPVINVINETGIPMRARGQPKFENNQWIVTIEAAVIESYDKGGAMRDIIEGRRS